MLNEKVMPILHCKLKDGVQLPIDGDKVQYNDAFNWSNDPYVLNNIEYTFMNYGLCNTNKGTVSVVEGEYDLIPNNIPKADIVAIKGFKGNCLDMATLDGVQIDGYALAGELEGGYISIHSSDERHEDEADGTTVDLYVTASVLREYFDVYSCDGYVPVK